MWCSHGEIKHSLPKHEVLPLFVLNTVRHPVEGTSSLAEFLTREDCRVFDEQLPRSSVLMMKCNTRRRPVQFLLRMPTILINLSFLYSQSCAKRRSLANRNRGERRWIQICDSKFRSIGHSSLHSVSCCVSIHSFSVRFLLYVRSS